MSKTFIDKTNKLNLHVCNSANSTVKLKLKITSLLLFVTYSFTSFAQCALFTGYSEPSNFNKTIPNYHPSYDHSVDKFYFQDLNTELNLCLATDYFNEMPPPSPILTTKFNLLEVCEGNSTTLTAVSNYPIEWYTSYPPEGEPIALGEVFVTPPLKQGYYIYHAVANNNGLKSKSSEMEVVMVYPLPFVRIVESASSICAGESVTLSAFGTRFYSWNTGETSNEIVIQPKHTSTFEVTGINTAGCKQTQKYTQHVENCIEYSGLNSIEKNEQSQKEVNSELLSVHTIYPNPTSGEFHVKLNIVSESTRIELYNSFGELVYSKKAEEEVTKIELNGATKGIYTLRILDQNQLLSQDKVIIED